MTPSVNKREEILRVIVSRGVGGSLIGLLKATQNGGDAMYEFCKTCKHDRRSHHKVGGCCFKIPPYVGEVKTCNCKEFK